MAGPFVPVKRVFGLRWRKTCPLRHRRQANEDFTNARGGKRCSRPARLDDRGFRAGAWCSAPHIFQSAVLHVQSTREPGCRPLGGRPVRESVSLLRSLLLLPEYLELSALSRRLLERQRAELRYVVELVRAARSNEPGRDEL